MFSKKKKKEVRLKEKEILLKISPLMKILSAVERAARTACGTTLFTRLQVSAAELLCTNTLLANLYHLKLVL